MVAGTLNNKELEFKGIFDVAVQLSESLNLTFKVLIALASLVVF